MAFSSNDQGKFISWVIATRSVTQAQRNFENTFSRKSPSQYTIGYQYKKFMDAGSVLHKKCTPGDPQVISQNSIYKDGVQQQGMVHITKIQNIEELRLKIIDAFQAVGVHQLLQNTRRQPEYRFETFGTINGNKLEIKLRH